jgi:hypothetical protein
MNQNQKRVYVTDKTGTSQYTRALDSLSPNYALIDERNMSDLLSFAAEYSKLLHFYNEKNTIDGNWQPFWLKDISIFLADLAHTDYLQFQQQYNGILEELSAAHSLKEKAVTTRNLILLIQSMQQLLNNWYVQTTAINAIKTNKLEGIELDLYNIIKLTLSRNIEQLHGYQLGLREDRIFRKSQIITDLGISKVWGDLEKVEPTELNGDNKIEKLSSVFKKIELVYNSFYKAIIHILHRIPNYLEKSLTEDDTHFPNTSLYIAFLRLFEIQQANLNSISGRHLDYYYFNILKDKLKDGTPDKAHIYFDLAPNSKQYELPAGTLFDGGTNDENEAVVYILDKDTTITRAKVEELKTIFISKNLFFGGSDYRLIANIYAAPVANSKDGKGGSFDGDKLPVWATFGEDQFEKMDDTKNMETADIGFAVTSPILFLEEGERNVTITLKFEEDSMETHRKLLANLVQKEREKQNKTSESDIFQKSFSDSFHIKITGENGWIDVDKYEVFLPNGTQGTEISIAFQLIPSEDSVVAYNEALHQEQLQTHWAMAKFTLKPGKATYSFMRDLVLENINIKVKVNNLKNFELFSDLGRLDASKPFQPFGSTPVQDSSLIIGKTEIFKKNITNLGIKIKWQNLPKLKGGFEEYYQNYRLPINNDVFRAELTALSNSEFHPKEGATPIEFGLFNTEPNKSNKKKFLRKSLKISNLNLEDLNIQPNFYLNNTDDFDQNKRSGYFKMTLASPDFGFGHDIYPRVFTNIVTENASVSPRNLFGGNEKKNKEIPNPPFIPVINELTMSYEAESNVSLSAGSSRSARRNTPEEIYHIHPFGKMTTFSKGVALSKFIMPQYDEDGYLYVGVSNVSAPEPLSLYFELIENNINLTNKEFRPPKVKWSYLSRNEWIDFDKNEVLADTTLGFTKSGIVQLDLSSKMTKSNSILSGNCYWLRIAVTGDVEILSKALDVKAQGAMVTWQYNENNLEHLHEPLAASRISDTIEPHSAINEVTQPYASFDGYPKENKRQFYSRISDRLQHKRRGITTSDIERLILEYFSFIRQVRCYTPISHPKLIKQGDIKVVVIPVKERNMTYNQPLVNYRKINEIQAFVQSIASSFVNIEVINPVYELVKVSCDVIFNKKGSEGALFKQLNKDIKNYINPWIENEIAPINLGGVINKDSILAFIEQLPYVNFVTRLSLVQVFQNSQSSMGNYEIEDTASPTKSTAILKAYTPWSVLVPVDTHHFSLLDTASYNAPVSAGLESMSIGIDYVIKEITTEEEKEDYFQEIIQGEPEAMQRFILDIDLDD